MSDKRIIEYDTATELSDDDYLVLDSVTGGTSKILAKKLEPPKPEYITATYTQTITVKDTDSLDVLRPDLVVKAYYDGGIVETVTNYTLSGTLEVGTSTITVSYKGFTDTFDVTVSSSITYFYNWDFTQSLTDSVQGVTATLKGGARQNSNGLIFNDYDQICQLGSIDLTNKIIDIDISSFNFSGNNGYNINLLINRANSSSYNTGALIYNKSTGYWSTYGYTEENPQSTSSSKGWSSTSYNLTDRNAFNNCTIKIVFNNSGNRDLYINDIYQGTTTKYLPYSLCNNLEIGGNYISNRYNGNQCYNMTITGVRIYANT